MIYLKRFNDHRLAVGFLFLCAIWLMAYFLNTSVNGVFSDEFIYFNSTHKSLSFLDFILYDPIKFFGHTSLVSFFHWCFSFLTLKGLRALHMVGFFLFLCFFRPSSLWQALCILYLLVHPTFLTHSIFLYPEIIQSLMGVALIYFYQRGQFRLSGALFLWAIAWRESSLAFLIAIFFICFLEKKWKSLVYFIPGLSFLAIHLGRVAWLSAWNPGRVAANEHLPTFFQAFNSLYQTASFLLGGILLVPVALWLLVYFLKPKFPMGQAVHRIETILLSFCTFGFLFLVFSDPVLDSWIFLHRLNSLGYLGLLVSFGLAFYSCPKELPKDALYCFISALVFFLFFLFYRDVASRDLIPSGLLAIYGLSRLKPNKTLIWLLVIGINIGLSLNFSKASEFLSGSQAGLNSHQRDQYLRDFNSSLDQTKRLEVKLGGGAEEVLTDSFFVEKAVSRNAPDQKYTHFLSYNRELSLAVESVNTAFTLYRLDTN